MTWKVTRVMDEKIKFIADLLTGEKSMTDACSYYCISRKTGYKWFNRYQAEGPSGLEDRSRAPHHHPNAIPEKVEKMILAMRATHPTWGPIKLLKKLETKYPRQKRWAALSSIGELLKRRGLVVNRKKRRRTPLCEKPLTQAKDSGHVWCADFKGWFPTQDGARCNPLTITDDYSRFIIRCQQVNKMSLEIVKPLFEAAFREYGLPQVIRTDNGAPFASVGLGGFSKLSVWWKKLGIVHERIEPGKPGQNGRHERMHLTLKNETASPPAANLRTQQRRFDKFCKEFNYERPHQALELRTPAELFKPSERRYRPTFTPIQYGPSMIVRAVQPKGEINLYGNRINIGEAFYSEKIGLEQIDETLFRVWFTDIELGALDLKKRRITPKSKTTKKNQD